MAATIFHSWQTDTPNNIGRNFQKAVLNEICREIQADLTLSEAERDVEIDSDTSGVAGSPAIVDVIFRKIDAAAVFVADMTYTGTRLGGEPTPNPNVLEEHGWALKSLGHNRVLSIMNTAYGKPEDRALPFDLRHLRWPLQYQLPEDATPEVKRQVKAKLKSELGAAIRASLKHVPAPPIELPPPFPAAEQREGQASFRDSGTPLGLSWTDIPFLSQPEVEVFFSNGAAVWLRLMPKYDSGRRWAPDELRQRAVRGGHRNLLPLSDISPRHLRAAEGIGAYSITHSEEDRTGSVAFAFETGEVWAVDTQLLNFNAKVFSLQYVVDRCLLALVSYGRFLQSLGIEPPFLWRAGMVGMKGRKSQMPQAPNSMGQPLLGPSCVSDAIVAEGMYTPGEDLKLAFRPFIDLACRRCCGIPRPDYM